MSRTTTYCVVPRDLAAKLHEPLRRFFRETDPSVEVVVEARRSERRASPNRRAAAADWLAAGETTAAVTTAERRTIRCAEGRRAGERRAALVPADARELPRRARRYADQLVFIERIEPSAQYVEDLDSARLVAALQAGDANAFSLLYTRYFDRVYSYLRLVLRDPHDAEDATQQVFLRVMEALPRYERRTKPFRSWLFTVVRNQALTLLDRSGRVEPMAARELNDLRAHEESPDTSVSVLNVLTDRELMLFIERLPLAQSQVLILRFMLDLTPTEIATVLGKTPNAVRAIQHRALRVLEQRLRSLGREPTKGGRTRMRRWIPQSRVLRSRRYSLVR